MSTFKPRVSVLGSGTCHPGLGGKHRAHPGFFIRWGESDQHLLLECSENMPVRLEAIGEPIEKIKHIAISHSHVDHCLWPPFVQAVNCALSWGEKGLPSNRLHLFAPADIVGNIPVLNRVYFPETITPFGAGLSNPEIVPHVMLQSTVDFDDGVKLLSFPVYHGFGRTESLAFRLELPGMIFACWYE